VAASATAGGHEAPPTRLLDITCPTQPIGIQHRHANACILVALLSLNCAVAYCIHVVYLKNKNSFRVDTRVFHDYQTIEGGGPIRPHGQLSIQTSR